MRDEGSGMIPLRQRAGAAGLPVHQTADRRSCGILGRRRSPEEPVDRAASVEIAQNAIPTPAWTAHRTRRPQRPTGPVGFTEAEQMRKMTRLPEGGARH